MANWKNKVVVVTGGSDGLGRSIAMAFSADGAKSILLARDETRLRTVAEAAVGQGLDVDWIVCDVSSDTSVAQAVDEIIRRYGRIDVWVNNVGRSSRIKFAQCGVEEYQASIDINFYSAVRCTLAVLDHVTATSGQIVNIGSLAAKTGWQNVASYAVGKHALAAFSHQMRIEGPSNVNCLFVCMGPIKRADASVRYADQVDGLDESAKKPGAGVKLKGICPDLMAAKIVRGCRGRKKEIVLPFYTRFLFAILQLSPSFGDFLLRRSSKK